jgi:hypothetical protein
MSSVKRPALPPLALMKISPVVSLPLVRINANCPSSGETRILIPSGRLGELVPESSPRKSECCSCRVCCQKAMKSIR